MALQFTLSVCRLSCTPVLARLQERSKFQQETPVGGSPLHAIHRLPAQLHSRVFAWLQERGKFQQETLVNVGGRQRKSSLAERK